MSEAIPNMQHALFILGEMNKCFVSCFGLLHSSRAMLTEILKHKY